MKKLEKLLLMVLVFALALTFGTKINAEEEEKGKITISNAVVGETYKIYKMFDLESYDKTNGTYAYKITSDWEDFFEEGAAGHGYVDIDEDGYVLANTLDNTNVAEFAKKALVYAKANLTATDSEDATSSTTGAVTTTVEFTDLDLGYYLVDTTLGTLCGLDTTDNEKTINEKNTIPTLVNQVQESTTYGPTNDTEIGDRVYYKDTINAYKGAENYKVHVSLDSGLTFDSSSVVVKEGTDTLTPGTDYNVVTSSLPTGETFEIVFTQTYLDSITGTSTTPTEIIATYEAVLNGEAVIAGTGNLNSAFLSYGEKNDVTTTDVTKTYTWKSNYFKYYYDKDDTAKETKLPLKDAQFVISRSSSTSDAIELVEVATNVYRLATSTDATADIITTITTDTTGLFEIRGLDDSSYYLIETVAPDGYNKLRNPVIVVIDSTANATDETMTYEVKVSNTTVTRVDIENKSGTILPSTGGAGTKLIILIGSILFLSTAVVLVTKKRMYNAG